MNNIMQKEMNAYFKNVEGLLLCDRKNKKIFMAELKNDIEDYLQQDPSADFDGIVSAFGSPEEIAESFLRNADIVSIKKKMNVKKILFFTLLAIVAVYILFVAASYLDVHTEAHGYFEEGILRAGFFLRGAFIR